MEQVYSSNIVMTQPSLEVLLDKYLSGTMTEEERLLFKVMLEQKEHQQQLETIIDNELHEHAYETNGDNSLLSLIQENIQQQIQPEKRPAPVIRFGWLTKAAAAAIFIVLLGGGYFFWHNFQSRPQQVTAVQPLPDTTPDIIPGTNKAILKLADGTEIQLQHAAKGTLAQQGNATVVKLDSGQLAYHFKEGMPQEQMMNTITTPKGGQYQLQLADGSKVWLNAASSLRFPASFTGGKRVVALTGEGYFEIAKNASMPFYVAVNGVQVQVLGTHFNVNAYEDETDLRTTLLEGSVRIFKGTETAQLQPGEQAVVFPKGSISVNQNVNIEEVMAWKNGMFHFKSAGLETILRQAARWYNVDFRYEEKISERFTGQISRNVNLSQLLQILELTGRVHFKQEGRTIVVTS